MQLDTSKSVVRKEEGITIEDFVFWGENSSFTLGITLGVWLQKVCEWGHIGFDS